MRIGKGMLIWVKRARAYADDRKTHVEIGPPPGNKGYLLAVTVGQDRMDPATKIPTAKQFVQGLDFSDNDDVVEALAAAFKASDTADHAAFVTAFAASLGWRDEAVAIVMEKIGGAS